MVHHKTTQIIERTGELIERGHRKKARKLLLSLVESRAPGYEEAIIPLALLFERSGDLGEAARLYRLGLESQHATEGPQAALNLGILLRDALHDLEGARVAFEAAYASRHPDITPAAVNNLARVAHLEGDVERAMRGYRIGISSGHEDYAPVAMLKLAELLEEAGDVEEAAVWYGAALATQHVFVTSEARAAIRRVSGALDRGNSNWGLAFASEPPM